MSVTYACDHCGEEVDTYAKLHLTELVANSNTVDAEHPKKVIWNGDLCDSCRWKLAVMLDKAKAKVYERFAGHSYNEADWMVDEPGWVEAECDGIESLMERYGEVCATPQVKEYQKLSAELYDAKWKHGFRTKAETEFYKEAHGYEFTLEKPYDELLYDYEKAYIKHHDWSFCYKTPDGKKFNACLSLCGNTREQIEDEIEQRIAKIGEDACD